MGDEEKLTIQYSGGLDSKLDDELEKVVKKFGWKFSGRGFDHEDKMRDLGFYKSIE